MPTHNGAAMERIKPRWTIAKRHGQWRIYDRGIWHDTYNTLPEAHTEATQNAVADVLYTEGGLTLLEEMKEAWNHKKNGTWPFRWWVNL
jgi:hypothetical protein